MSEPFLAPSTPEVHKPLDLRSLSGRKPLLVAALLIILWLATGVVCFRALLDLTWASAFYFAVTTSLTVGYGDIDAWNAMTQNTTTANDGTAYDPANWTLVFTMLYIIGGIIVVGASLGLLMHSLLESSSSASVRSRFPVAVSSVLCVVCLLVGAAVASAVEGYDFVHGLYWAVVTMSTVGYGSGVPKTDGARLFCAVFMLLGVGAMGNLVGELSARPLRARQRLLEEKVLNQYGASLEAAELSELARSETLARLGLRRQAGVHGVITRDAFCLLMLVRSEKLDADDLRRCQAAFDALDADGSGPVVRSTRPTSPTWNGLGTNRRRRAAEARRGQPGLAQCRAIRLSPSIRSPAARGPPRARPRPQAPTHTRHSSASVARVSV